MTTLRRTIWFCGGDPASNGLLKKIATRLPIGWNTRRIALDGIGSASESFRFSAANGKEVPSGNPQYISDQHALILIYPNPLNPKRYVVLNSGFTFRGFGSNADQTPKLPDYAIVGVNTPP